MEYREYKPHGALSRFIECYWSAYSERPPFREKERLIPDGTIELMFNFADNYSHIRDGVTRSVKGSHVIGIRSRALIISQTRKQHFFCVRFKPGGLYPFFRIPVHLFADDFTGVEELFDHALRNLEEQLYEAGTNEKKVALADRYFLEQFDGLPEDYAFVGAFAREFLAGDVKVAELATRFGTNYKTLERKFRTVIGLTPSQLSRVKRFNEAVLKMYSCRYSTLTAVAYDSGYFDQSHFIREFKQLTGLAPRQFLHEQYTIVKVIQPAIAERLSKSYNF